MWLVGTDDAADRTLYDADLAGPVALVMGSEGEGLRRLTRDCCDLLVSIPMAGAVESLNVSVATGVVAVRGRAAAVGQEVARRVRLRASGTDSRRPAHAGPASPVPTPDTRRLGEFFAGAKNSHGASSVTGPGPKRRRPGLGPSITAGMDE